MMVKCEEEKKKPSYVTNVGDDRPKYFNVYEAPCNTFENLFSKIKTHRQIHFITDRFLRMWCIYGETL